MAWSDHITEIFSIASAVIASIGGAGIVLVALSSWLGKIWASRILEREKAEITRSIEATKSELIRSVERDKAALNAFLDEHRSELQQLAAERLDALNRRRDVYARLATEMRVFLRPDGGPPIDQEERKRAFLAAYDEGYIWASEQVASAIHDFVEALEIKTRESRGLAAISADAPDRSEITAHVEELAEQARMLYQRCLLEMRKDAGFSATQVGYRVVTV